MMGMIFDLDGTLIDSYELDELLYRQAVWSEVPEVSFRDSWHEYRHSTDSGILMEILEEFSLSAAEHYRSIRRRFGALIKEHLRSGDGCKLIPGASALLHKLHHLPQAKIGIATGGWGHTARMKLKAVGLAGLDLPVSSSDDSDSRAEIMKICAAKMNSSILDYVYVGDAEWDLTSAQELGWKFIGVGKRLKGKCDIWVPDLRDDTPFLKIIS
jgi:phosphoglycolate phosphatase-like HAD superfamily hydrolase